MLISVDVSLKLEQAAELFNEASDVAEPEPVERQHFAGAGAEVFFGSGYGYENSYKILRIICF
jgi:hypothetical protein